MDSLRANNVSRIIDEYYNDLGDIYESIVDEDGNEVKLIDQLIAKLKVLKNNLNISDEI